jgi:2-hydroxy-3-keto-5-methylthiopentenyl-1-phosphate phosphatase
MIPSPTQRRKILIQCDFDGTITEKDVSFVLLDAFAGGEWRLLLKDYKEGGISVGRLNREAFAMVKADRQSLLEAMKGKVQVRAGFHQLVNYCRRVGFRFVIVSNGLDFYIDKILKDLGLQDIEVFAAQTQFHPEGLQVQYIGPEGNVLDDGFKEAYVNHFLRDGYWIVYVGNGTSDFPPAKLCHYIFATGDLLPVCRKENAQCTAFDDFNEIVRGLELL